jgi:formate hydrogenlyase subunit 6/NADH:ubiquinone oxidoreductase subunit I
MQKKEQTYFETIINGILSLMEGFGLTFKHFRQASQKRKPIGVENKDYFLQDTGIVTTEYPYEAIPVPDNGRYRLNNEIDDCIVCDLCAKICPVNCIDIVPIKSPEEIGKTSDGTTKRIYAATFDIDMAKCCYCGLCTTVCPTECLTMTKTFDYSEYDVRNMTYHFTDLSPEQAEERKQIYEEYEKEKQRLKAESVKKTEETGTTESGGEEKPVEKKPAFKPVIKSIPKPEEKKDELKEALSEGNESKELPKPKPVFKPVIKAPVKTEENKEETKAEDGNPEAKDASILPTPKPVFKPVIKLPPKKDDQNS